MARPHLNPKLAEEALALCRQGVSPQEVEARMRAAGKQISFRTIYTLIAEAKATGTYESAPEPDFPLAPPLPEKISPEALADVGVVIDPDVSPLELARGLLRSITDTIAKLPLDSPRLNPARAEARQLVKLVAALEAEQAAKETPEEAERRRRREDGETRKAIEQYVLQAEADARRPRMGAPHGVCVTCGAALRAPEGAL